MGTFTLTVTVCRFRSRCALSMLIKRRLSRFENAGSSTTAPDSASALLSQPVPEMRPPSGAPLRRTTAMRVRIFRSTLAVTP